MSVDSDAAFTNTDNVAFPLNAAINATGPATADGTEFVKLMIDNYMFGPMQAILAQTGQTPDGSVEIATASQMVEGFLRLLSTGVVYIDSGAADAYVLGRSPLLQAPVAYYDSMVAAFKPDNSNTGATTVNIAGLGVKSVTRSDGSALTGNEFVAGVEIQIRYSLADDRFEITASASGEFVSAEFDYDVNTIKTFAHGLASVPKKVSVRARCIIAEYGYILNDYAHNLTFADGTREGSFGTLANSTNVQISTGDLLPQVIAQVAGATANFTTITFANWKFSIVAEL